MVTLFLWGWLSVPAQAATSASCNYEAHVLGVEGSGTDVVLRIKVLSSLQLGNPVEPCAAAEAELKFPVDNDELVTTLAVKAGQRVLLTSTDVWTPTAEGTVHTHSKQLGGVMPEPPPPEPPAPPPAAPPPPPPAPAPAP